MGVLQQRLWMERLSMNAHKAALVLVDGTVFQGDGFGATGIKTGEVVFNTSMTGYQEILTDPSYAGQMVLLTYPHIGNTGINADDVESRKIFASGLIVKECARRVSNYRSQKDLSSYLKSHGIPGLAGIDTRALVKHIREQGAMPGVLAIGDFDLEKLKAQAKTLPSLEGQNLAKDVSCKEPYVFSESLKDFITTQPLVRKPILNVKKYKVVAYDFGAKKNILRLLVECGCDVTVVPYDYPADQILKDDAVDGVFLSNGPGDPAACLEAIQNVKKLLGHKPLFGICLGHQILALALGAKTFKLKFGHHGGNQPVKNLKTSRVEITAQNHGFAVSPENLPNDLEVTHLHLNDQTVAGIKHKSLPAFSVQYHPEASPGPHDSQYIFDEFIQMMKLNR